jgi:hypothetical protein
MVMKIIEGLIKALNNEIKIKKAKLYTMVFY